MVGEAMGVATAETVFVDCCMGGCCCCCGGGLCESGMYGKPEGGNPPPILEGVPAPGGRDISPPPSVVAGILKGTAVTVNCWPSVV